ncbi:MAG: ferredoxin:glutaredoxin reductase [Actinobacteria bacterium]|nr:ferredoxin:glutaredoxin reductase [Actinomycetota bacterium]
MSGSVSPEEIVELFYKIEREAEDGGYSLNPDRETAMMLIEGLVTNIKRYGYQLCPCRLGTGDQKSDLDIICPCDYRDPDLDDHDACYCSLYVSARVVEGEVEVEPVPERRPPEKVLNIGTVEEEEEKAGDVKPEGTGEPVEAEGIPVWRCGVCGYLCARENPPEVCPICKAGRERFKPFTFS